MDTTAFFGFEKKKTKDNFISPNPTFEKERKF